MAGTDEGSLFLKSEHELNRDITRVNRGVNIGDK